MQSRAKSSTVAFITTMVVAFMLVFTTGKDLLAEAAVSAPHS
jgi:hypothetical protein